MEKLFAEDIQAQPLVANNSRWANFRTRRTETWHKGNVVLIGDAVHTAHFSVGSGTKMAMEDAVTLAREVAAHQDNLELALISYEVERQPSVAKIQDSARPSLSWWEHFGRYYEVFDPLRFTFHFFSRSIDIDKIRQRDPELVKAVEQGWHAQYGTEPLATPLTAGSVEFSSRLLSISNDSGTLALTGKDGQSLALTMERSEANSFVGVLVAAPESEHGLHAAFAQLPVKAAVVVIQGGNPLTRALLSEEARLGRSLKTVIVDDRDTNSAVTLVLSGRADAVVSPAATATTNA